MSGRRAYINDAAESPDRVGPENGLGAAASILHDRASDHDDILSGVGQLLDDKVDHLSQASILVLEQLRDAEEERRSFIGRELVARVEEEGDFGKEDSASSRLDRGAIEQSGCVSRVSARPANFALGRAIRAHTFLENLGPVHLDQPKVSVFVLFAVAHLGRRFGRADCREGGQGQIVGGGQES